MEFAGRAVQFDITERAGEQAQLSGTYYPAADSSSSRPVLVCLPGGTYTRGYFDLQVPGYSGYSFAEYATSKGFGIVALDMLGTGASSRPDRDIGYPDQAGAVAAAVAQLPQLIDHQGPFLGVGHSMGGYVAIFQQALDRSYAGVAILGTTNLHVATMELPDAFRRAADNPEEREERAALVQTVLSSMPERYVPGDRNQGRSWFYLDDVPIAVIDADTASTATVIPRLCAAETMVPGVAPHTAASIEVPVFLAFGELDVSPNPHREVAFYSGSHDVTLYLLEGSAHCHNMASTRRVLWDRLFAWCDTVTG